MKRRRRGLGATAPVHAGEARHAVQQATTIAKHVVQYVRKGSPATVCSGGLNSLANAYEAIGVARQESRHSGDSKLSPALKRAQRWVAAAHKTVVSRCFLR